MKALTLSEGDDSLARLVCFDPELEEDVAVVAIDWVPEAHRVIIGVTAPSGREVTVDFTDLGIEARAVEIGWLREWHDKTAPIIAALAIYGEGANVASLAEKARALNERGGEPQS